MRTQRRSSAFHFERHEARGHSFGFLFFQDRTPDEIRLVEIHKNRKSCLERCLRRREIGTVERVAHLETQRVARTETAGLDAVVLTALEDIVPRSYRAFCGAKDLESVFPGIASTADMIRHPVELH